MLKNIKLHISRDDKLQEEYEQKLAKQIAVTKNKNINAFSRFVPNLTPIVESSGSRNISLFCNKTGEFNLVDYGQGRVIYGFHPEQEVINHVEEFAEKAAFVDVTKSHQEKADASEKTDTCESFKQLPKWLARQDYASLPENPDCIVMLGCGLGYQISWLIQQYSIKHLIVYEPEGQYFQSSSHILDWSEIFNQARAKGTAIYLQVGKDSRDLVSDITELSSVFDLDGFYIYQHYHHPVFNSVFDACVTRDWQSIKDQGIFFGKEQSYLDYLPPWLPGTVSEQYQDVDKNSELFTANIAAFKEFFPDIHKEFESYTPVKWLPVVNPAGEINILHMNSLTNWYSDSPTDDCQGHYDNFNLQPNKDGLALGYTGKKLRHYRHYKFVAKTEKLLKEIEEVQGSLPEKIKSIIIFGLGSGYQLQTLYDNHDIEYIFVCEPNRDFFYASLFAIPWSDILKSVAEKKQRIYLNIGDDGSNLTRDIINQFYSIGPYIVNSTYFYQSYFNSSLNAAIAQLREQLQVIIAMGEYFDHAWYGIHQTHTLLESNAPVLLKDPGKHLNFDNKEVPVFVIGNGPSIDTAIEYLHEYRDQVILVSCGTALRVLHRNGITPDFQAEIEQNRTTYDWAVLVNDLDYLKNISLISCNGIHPDTCRLYKDVYITFKDGESSTVSSTNILGEENFEMLKFAFPTVANFAVNLFTTMEFNTIYLVGIDLGFVDKNHHHSKSSSYYLDNGKELYNYSKENNTSLVVPGNFRPVVNTKHEFKISRVIIEQILANTHKSTQIYNTSDGAKIAGTFPLRIESLLITNTKEQRFAALKAVKQKCFETIDGAEFTRQKLQRFQQTRLVEEIDRLLKLLESSPKDLNEAEKYIEKQKLTLFSSYERNDNLLFYYLYGTSNYANAFLTKLLCSKAEEGEVPEQFFDGLKMWESFLHELKNVLDLSNEIYDNSHFNLYEREVVLLQNRAIGKRILFVSNSTASVNSFRTYNEDKLRLNCEITYCGINNIPESSFDFILYNLLPELPGCPTLDISGDEFKSLKRGNENTFYVAYDQESNLIQQIQNSHVEDISFVSFHRDHDHGFEEKLWLDDQAGFAQVLAKIIVDKQNTQLYIPKYFVCDIDELSFLPEMQLTQLEEHFDIVSFKFYLSCNPKGKVIDMVSTSGTRGVSISKKEYQQFSKTRIYSKISRGGATNSINYWIEKVPEIAEDIPFDGTLNQGL